MKKGFTLVELLAVVVVLAILSLVAMPIVGNVIKAGRESAIENSVKFYIREIETEFSEWVIEGIPSTLTYVSNNNNIEIDVVNLNNVVKFEGTKPIAGTIVINNDYNASDSHFGYVVSANLDFEDGYVVYTYKNNLATVEIELK